MYRGIASDEAADFMSCWEANTVEPAGDSPAVTKPSSSVSEISGNTASFLCAASIFCFNSSKLLSSQRISDLTARSYTGCPRYILGKLPTSSTLQVELMLTKARKYASHSDRLKSSRICADSFCGSVLTKHWHTSKNEASA